MTLQGFVYYVDLVYSYWGESVTSEVDACEDSYIGVRSAEGRKNKRSLATNGAKTAEPVSSGRAGRARSSADREAKRLARREKTTRSGKRHSVTSQHYHGKSGHDMDSDRPIFEGWAWVINGVVTTMAGRFESVLVATSI